MTARMPNAATLLPQVNEHIQGLLKSVQGSGVPQSTLELVHLRASQINACGFCVDLGTRTARKSGESDQRLHAVAAWRDTPYFTEAERAALALAEAATRLADRSDAVPDEVWDEAARHFEDKQLAGLLLMIGVTNLFNRLNVPVRQPSDQQDW
ncbi:carboxymuconolactone decarboxylase family protein [Streptomyces smyrnaeus]|uniref:carboxymuconolactone decarboxylase family protein n=1 Tax=Streptomyces TaxID=1883 RepID=UPI000C18FB90|nr:MULTISPECIES: carboxymuconolactone decarboxylase family protein [unclassified Streptomyces]MBQ0868261.1 carboxymuconolactone decarboxylase family protein [Streptomyces sp. RK75]MBQ1124540.1 carboxymuconolactone decarboxylase family protein [Streptomyces sp. B15]MBQ1162848.1 carboxymuconolactone decarboxylase family protein [Streptomyces sp. A73]